MLKDLTVPHEHNLAPNPVVFYEGSSDIDGLIPKSTHPWGQLNCLDTGIALFSVNQNRLIGLPGVGIWFPPGVEHECSNHCQLQFKVMNVTPELCQQLPNFACMIGLTDIFQVIWKDIFSRKLFCPAIKEDLNLFSVLLDQLKSGPSQLYLLPMTNDPLLSPILKHLEQYPDDNSGLAYWADKVFATERTIARRFKSTLNMSFREWRLRLRFLHSIALLNHPLTIEAVALSVGYSTSSAFIHMFQTFAGISPERYRKSLQSLGNLASSTKH